MPNLGNVAGVVISASPPLEADGVTEKRYVLWAKPIAENAYEITAYYNNDDAWLPIGAFGVIDDSATPSLIKTFSKNKINELLALRVPLSQRNQADGYAGLDSDGKLLASMLPSIAITSKIVASESTLAAFAANSGNYVFEQGDVIVIDNSGNLEHWFYWGGTATDINNYSAVSSSIVEWDNINGRPENTSDFNNDGADGNSQYVEFADLYVGNALIKGNYFNTPDTYEYFAWASKYIIDNVMYTNYISNTVTLATADPTHDRFDIIVINNNETISVITGTPSANPAIPDIDEETQLALVIISVTAATTAPEGVTNELVYNENVQVAGGEWDTASVGAVTLDSTEDFQLGTKSIKFTAASSADRVTFTHDSLLNGGEISNIILRVKLITVPSNQRFWIRCYNTAGPDGVGVMINNGQFNFDASLLNVWQDIIVPASVLGVSTKYFDQIRFDTRRNASTFFLDNIIIQKGTNSVDILLGAQSDWAQADGNEPDYIKNKPTALSQFTNDIGAGEPILANTIFVDTEDGDNDTAEIENRTKPFATDAAAYAAIPDDGNIWTIEYIDGNVTRAMTAPFPAKSFKLYSVSSGVFDFSSHSGGTALLTAGSKDIDIQNATLLLGGADKDFGSTDSWVKIKAKVLSVSCGGTVGSAGIIKSQNTLAVGNELIFEDIINDNANCIFGIISDLIVTGNFEGNIANAQLFGNGGTLKDVTINKITLGVATYRLTQKAPSGVLKIKELAGTGAFSIGSYLGTHILDLDGIVIASTVTFTLSDRLNGQLTIKGTIKNYSGYLTVTSNYSAAGASNLIKFDNFVGKVNVIYYGSINSFEFRNSQLTFATALMYATGSYGGVGDQVLKSVTFSGINVFTSENVNQEQLIERVLPDQTVTVRGYTSGNFKTFGKNITAVYEAISTKEKTKEIIIKSKYDLLDRDLDASAQYIIDGNLTLLDGEYIEVPVGGLTINGYGFNVSSISKDVAGQSIFTSPVGGSGDFISGMLTYYGGDGSVFDITDVDGTHAIELNDVNFIGCSSIGELDGYRQFTGTTNGIYGCDNGFTLSGTWNGFKLTNTNAFGFDAAGTLFKEGTALSFTNRFFISVNIDFPDGAILCDFDSGNFTLDELFQVNSCIAKVDGVIDIDNAETLIPNISANDAKSLWVGNIGLPDTADEKFVEIADAGATHAIDWLYDTHEITVTEDLVLTEKNLPAPSKNTGSIQVYINPLGYDVTFPAGWVHVNSKIVGTLKANEINEIIVKYLNTNTYFIKINNSLAVYPAPDLSSVSPISMLPSETREIDVYGSFFTPASIIEFGTLTIVSTEFVNSGHLKVTVTSTASEEEIPITISNGTSVVFNGYFEVNIGTVFIPQSDEWTLDAGSVDYTNAGQVLTSSNNTTGTATWTGRDIDFSKNIEVRFTIFKSPFGGTSYGTVYILNLIDKITSAMGGTSSQYAGGVNFSLKSTDDEVVQITLGSFGYDSGIDVKMKWTEATKTMQWYVNNVLQDTSIDTIFETTNLQTLEINIARNMDVKNIKYIEIPD